jgi:hypothetical protein
MSNISFPSLWVEHLLRRIFGWLVLYVTVPRAPEHTPSTLRLEKKHSCSISRGYGGTPSLSKSAAALQVSNGAAGDRKTCLERSSESMKDTSKLGMRIKWCLRLRRKPGNLQIFLPPGSEVRAYGPTIPSFRV